MSDYKKNLKELAEAWGASFSIQYAPELTAEEDEGTLILEITSDLPHKDFLIARKELFKRLRANGCENLCMHLAVLRQ